MAEETKWENTQKWTKLHYLQIVKSLEILVKKYGLCSDGKWESQKVKEIGDISLGEKKEIKGRWRAKVQTRNLFCQEINCDWESRQGVFKGLNKKVCQSKLFLENSSAKRTDYKKANQLGKYCTSASA